MTGVQTCALPIWRVECSGRVGRSRLSLDTQSRRSLPIGRIVPRDRPKRRRVVDHRKQDRVGTHTGRPRHSNRSRRFDSWLGQRRCRTVEDSGECLLGARDQLVHHSPLRMDRHSFHAWSPSRQTQDRYHRSSERRCRYHSPSTCRNSSSGDRSQNHLDS